MERPCHFLVLIELWATTQDFWQPEVRNGCLHVCWLVLRRGRFNPLRRIPSSTADHVGQNHRLRIRLSECILLRIWQSTDQF